MEHLQTDAGKSLVNYIAPVSFAIFMTTILQYWLNIRNRGSRCSKGEEIVEPPFVTSYVPFLGSALEFSADCKAFVQKYTSKFGNVPIFSANIAGQTYHFVTVSEYPIEQIFRQKHLSFLPVANDALTKGFGSSQEAANALNHQLNKEFKTVYHKHLLGKEGLSAITTDAQKQIRALIPKLIEGGDLSGRVVVPMYKTVQKIIFSATMHSLLSPLLSCPDVLESFEIFDKKFSRFLGGVPSIFLPGAVDARENILKVLMDPNFLHNQTQFLNDRQALIEKSNVSKEDGCRFNLAIMWGSIANTMPTTFWVLWYILSNENAYDAVQAEIDKISSEYAHEDGIFDQEALEKMVVIESIFKETLRLQSESLVARNVLEDCVFDLKIPGHARKYSLKKGSRVIVYPSMLHYDDEVFANSKEFQWDRFLASSDGKEKVFFKDGKLIANPIRPFGGGSSMCPGRKFALNEVKQCVATFFRHFHMSLDLVDGCIPSCPQTDPERIGLGVKAPETDVLLVLRSRMGTKTSQ